ncbi:MAG: hypothetical protein NC489_24910 [Ruminococcus flavefaciens]|nr:hypothetical protein [Ruminococcus flavefaciens]
METNLRAVVFYAKAGKGEMEGKHWENLSIQYLATDNLDPCADLEKSIYGLPVAFGKLPYNTVNRIVEVPGVYDIKYTMSVANDRNGKPQVSLTPVDLQFVASLAASSGKKEKAVS